MFLDSYYLHPLSPRASLCARSFIDKQNALKCSVSFAHGRMPIVELASEIKCLVKIGSNELGLG